MNYFFNQIQIQGSIFALNYFFSKKILYKNYVQLFKYLQVISLNYFFFHFA